MAFSGRLRVAVFNVENLFVLFDQELPTDFSLLSERDWQKLSISTTDNKSLRQTQGLAQAVREIDPDILLLCEVGGRESLENFNRYFLLDQYEPFLIEGNSDRGIDLGYLVKRSLGVSAELRSHKNREIDFLYPHERLTRDTGYTDRPAGRLQSHRFSRDVLELRLSASPKAEPSLIFLLVHLKSQIDRDRIDPSGRDRRKAELEKLIQIAREVEAEFDARVPVLLGGDFNGHAGLPDTDPEFEALYRETALRDALELAGRPREERFTYQQIQSYGSSRDRQLDYLFIPPVLARRLIGVETFVHRFCDELGAPLRKPSTVAEKKLLPSDHYPLVATFAWHEFALPNQAEVK